VAAAAIFFCILAVATGALGLWAYRSQQEAIAERDNATKEKQRADSQLVKAQTTQSLFLADLAHQQRTVGDAGTAALLAIRVRRGLSQERAFDAGVDRSYVGGLERQEENPTVDVLDRLARTLSVQMSELLWSQRKVHHHRSH